MSSRAIDENLTDLSSQVFTCCNEPKPVPLLTLGDSELFPCCPEGSCPIEATGIAIDGNTTFPLNALVETEDSVTFNLASIDIAQGTANQRLEVKVYANNGDITISNVSFSGATVTAAPAVPIYVLNLSVATIQAVLDTTSTGSFSVTISVTTVCGTVEFVQPFNVI